MGKKRPAAGDRGDPPKRLKDDVQRKGQPATQREKGSTKKTGASGSKQKANLVGSSHDMDIKY